jgi:hypothetical protein
MDFLRGDQVDRLLEAGPDDPELAGALLLDQEVDDRPDLVRRHVGRIGDLGLAALVQKQRRLLAGRGVVVLERDEAAERRIEQRAVAVEFAGLVGQVGEGIALQDRRHAVHGIVVADELEARRSRCQVVCDIAVVGPIRDPRHVELADEVVLDQRLLHSADDVHDIELGAAAAGEQLVHHRRRGVAHRHDVDAVASGLGKLGPVAGVPHPDVGKGQGMRRTSLAAEGRPGKRRHGAGRGELQCIASAHLPKFIAHRHRLHSLHPRPDSSKGAEVC